MLIYFITLILVFCFASLAQTQYIISEQKKINKKNIISGYSLYTFIVTFILISVAGFRYRVGADYGNYMSAFYFRSENWFESLVNFDEPGLAIICKISSLISNDYAIMFFIVSFITIALYLYTIKKYTKTYLLSILLFIFVGTWAGTFGAIRQYLAASIIFAGHRYMYEKKLSKYLLTIGIAMLFHRTAIIMFPIYFISNKRITIKTFFVLIILTLVIRFSYDYIFSLMSGFKGVDQSQYEYMQTTVNSMRILVTIAPIILYLGCNKRVKNNKETQFYSMLLFVNAIFMIATSGSAYLARAGIFTETFTVFAFPKLLSGYNKDNRKILIIIIIIFYAIYFFYQIYISNSLNNYQWIFSR